MKIRKYGSSLLTQNLSRSESKPDTPKSVHKMSPPITDNTLALQALAPTPLRHFRDLPKEVRNRIYYFLFEYPAGVSYPSRWANQYVTYGQKAAQC